MLCLIELPRNVRLGYPGRAPSSVDLTGVSAAPALNFSMTVRAQEHALGGLLSGLSYRARHAVLAEREALRGSIEMVELERCDAAVVAAQLASSPSFEHELALDATTFVRDVLDATASATKTLLATHVAGHAVSRARDLRRSQARGKSGLADALARHPRGLEAISSQPVADRGGAAIEDVRDVADRQLAPHDLGEQFAVDGPACGVTRRVGRREAVLAGPVRNGGGVAPELARDGLDGRPARQPLCQPLPLH
jgi:hypothetical protein